MLEDRHITATPEGVSLDVVLAGLGSRFLAYLLDFLIQVALLWLWEKATGPAEANGSDTTVLVIQGLTALFVFMDFIGYFVVSEMLMNGRSIGKRAAGLRVVRVEGGAPGFWSSTLRNVLRLIDMLPLFYLVGSLLILATPRNQRLGDLTGSTLVVRNRTAVTTTLAGTTWGDAGQWTAPTAAGGGWVPASPYGPGVLPPELAHWDVSAVTPADVTMVGMFLSNRGKYHPQARHRLGMQLAGSLWPKVAGAPATLHPEQFLEGVVLVKSIRG